MPDRVRTFLTYWRNSLADIDRRALEGAPESGFRLSKRELLSGQLSPESRRQLRRPERESGGDPSVPVPLQVAPFTLRRRFESARARAGERREFLPLVLPALAFADGRLTGDRLAVPWIGRSHLEPIALDVPILGSAADVDAFLTAHRPRSTNRGPPAGSLPTPCCGPSGAGGSRGSRFPSTRCWTVGRCHSRLARG